MINHNLRLVDTLYGIVKESEPDSSEYIIADYLLRNYRNIGSLNIYDVADECFVNRSSIRRFCSKIGYDNFLDLKNDCKSDDHSYNYFMDYQKEENYRQWYEGQMASCIADLSELITDEALERLAVMIHEGKQVYVCSSYSLAQYVNEFRRPLVIQNKIIRVMDDKRFDDQKLLSLTAEDVVIITSARGKFLSDHSEVFKNLKCKKVLITCSRKSAAIEKYDEVVFLSKEDYSDIKCIHGKLGIMYLFDLLVHIYTRKYGV